MDVSETSIEEKEEQLTSAVDIVIAEIVDETKGAPVDLGIDGVFVDEIVPVRLWRGKLVSGLQGERIDCAI